MSPAPLHSRAAARTATVTAVLAAVVLAAPAAYADARYNAYDQGVRHIATLAGYLSYGMMSLTVCFGVLTTTGWARRSVKRQTMYGGHMLLAVMTLAFGCIHAIAYVFQTGQPFTYVDAVIPLAGDAGVAPGIVGLELGIAVAVSIWVQRRLGYHRWHVIHYLAYVAFGASLVHVVGTSAEVQALGTIGIGVMGLAGACGLLLVLRMLPATTAVGARISPQEM